MQIVGTQTNGNSRNLHQWSPGGPSQDRLGESGDGDCLLPSRNGQRAHEDLGQRWDPKFCRILS